VVDVYTDNSGSPLPLTEMTKSGERTTHK